MTPFESDPGDEQAEPHTVYVTDPWSYRLWPGRQINIDGAILRVETVGSDSVLLRHERALEQDVASCGDSATSVMLTVAGRRFVCACGANVFAKRGDQYRCNGCEREYVGE
jgi:hypothetical protein